MDIARRRLLPDAIPLQECSNFIAITPDSQLALVTNMKANAVTVISIDARKAASKTIPVGQNPMGIAISPDGKMSLVANLHGSMTVLA